MLLERVELTASGRPALQQAEVEVVILDKVSKALEAHAALWCPLNQPLFALQVDLEFEGRGGTQGALAEVYKVLLPLSIWLQACLRLYFHPHACFCRAGWVYCAHHAAGDMDGQCIGAWQARALLLVASAQRAAAGEEDQDGFQRYQSPPAA